MCAPGQQAAAFVGRKLARMRNHLIHDVARNGEVRHVRIRQIVQLT
jgi:hypothetical protein